MYQGSQDAFYTEHIYIYIYIYQYQILVQMGDVWHVFYSHI